MTTMASQITSFTIVYSTVYSDADQRKHQSSAPLAFVWGIHRDRWIPRTKGQLRGKCFHLMTSPCISVSERAVHPNTQFVLSVFVDLLLFVWIGLSHCHHRCFTSTKHPHVCPVPMKDSLHTGKIWAQWYLIIQWYKSVCIGMGYFATFLIFVYLRTIRVESLYCFTVILAGDFAIVLAKGLSNCNDDIMDAIASQITNLMMVFSTVYLDTDKRKHQCSASLAFVRGLHRHRWIPRTKGQ